MLESLPGLAGQSNPMFGQTDVIVLSLLLYTHTLKYTELIHNSTVCKGQLSQIDQILIIY